MSLRQRVHRERKRSGNIIVLSGFMIVVFMALLALTIDIGVMMVADCELQRAADAAAIGAAWELLDEGVVDGSVSTAQIATNARNEADRLAQLNPVLGVGPQVANGDITVGYRTDPADTSAAIDTSGLNPANVLQLTVRRDALRNGIVPAFFARALGYNGSSVTATASAAIRQRIDGFKIPYDGSNVMILPFALDYSTYVQLKNNAGPDTTNNYGWDGSSVTNTADTLVEVNLYPQGTGSPGNRGTVDIGSNNNSTNDIARQIVSGCSPADLAHHGGQLKLSGGTMQLNGDTGISAGVKDELASIIGEPRIIPIFTNVSGNGNNAQYTIAYWCGVRIMDVKLTGKMSKKHLTIQRAKCVSKGVIGGSNSTSDYIFSTPWLIE